MKVSGSCHCGYIRYEAEVDPDSVIICHCTDCQTLSGSTFRTVVQTLPGTFRLLAGTPKVYVKIANSGNERQQTFCPDCGTPIYSAPPGEGVRAFGIRVGSVTQRDQLIPRRQFWCRSEQSWLSNLSAIERLNRQPGFSAEGGFAS